MTFSWHENFELTLWGHFSSNFFEIWYPPPVTCWASGNIIIFLIVVPNVGWRHQKARITLKFAIFGLNNPCKATKTFWDLITGQQTWHEWIVITLLSAKIKLPAIYYWRGTCIKSEEAIKSSVLTHFQKSLLGANPKPITISSSPWSKVY